MKIEEYQELTKGRPARRNRANHQLRVRPCAVATEQALDGVIYQSNSGAWLKLTDSAVIVCMPYPISANALWRATRSKTNDMETNILSQSARRFKREVFNQFAPLLKAIGWTPLNKLCEARIVVQPPTKAKTYSNATHPRYDVDNYSKPVLDALKGQGLLFSDDRIFISEKVEFAQPVPHGRVWLSCVAVGDVDWLHRSVPHDWLAGGEHVA